MQALKTVANAAARGAERLGALRALEGSSAGRAGLLHVLTYHRVAEPEATPWLHPGLVSATPQEFAEQVEAIVERHRVVSLAEVLAAFRERRPLPPRALLLTFDDAYADFATHAWPVLRAHALPAVLFVPTAFADDPARSFWWDRLHHAVARAPDPRVLTEDAAASDDRAALFKRLRNRVKSLPHHEAMAWVEHLCAKLEPAPTPPSVLGWDALRELAREGVALCPHTRNHPLLDRISPDEVRRELRSSRLDLEREIGPTPPVLAYPSGAHDAASVRVVADEGFELAFTTDLGVVDPARDSPLRLRRIAVTRGASDAVLRVQLLAQFARLNPVWDTAAGR